MTGSKPTNQTVSRPIRKFNPGTFQSDEEVIEQFVVRKRELDTVLEVLRGNLDSPSCQHIMVVGPRGRGKTMLLVRTAAELRTDQQLAKCLFPVRFMEESQEIFNVADFWLETLFHLARETAEQDRGLSQDLRETYGDLSSRWREQSHEALARAAVLEAADRLDRKLVLMVENLQSLCENVDDDFGWKLRGALQSEPDIMLLASATTRFEGLDDAEQPFFELFRTINMQPLDTDECRLLWQVVSGDTVSSREIRPLKILTGGNPRLLVIVAEFARHRSLRRLMEELVTLIDEHTEYFRGHLEVLAKTERRVYVSVMDLWQPSSAGEIATRARMGVRTVSTMLGRLVERGAVIVEGRGRKRLYAPSEPLYSIYYKLRRERDEAAIVENLIQFMVAFYDIGELDRIREQLYSEAIGSDVIHAGLDRALAKIPPANDSYSEKKWDFVKDATVKVEIYHQEMAERRLDEDIEDAFQEHAWQRVIEIVDEVITSTNADSSRLSESSIARIMHAKAFAYEQLRDFHAVIAACNELVKRFGESGEPEIRTQVAAALLDKGRAKQHLGNLEGAAANYDEVVARGKESEVPSLQWLAVPALHYKGGAKKEQGDLRGAIAAFDEVVQLYGESDAPDVQFWVAASLVNKAEAIIGQGDAGEALSVYEEVVKRYGESNAPGVQSWVAGALIDRGRLRKDQGHLEKALVNYQDVVERYGDNDEPELRRYVAGALIDMGRTKEELGDLVGAMASWDEMVSRYGNRDETIVQRLVTGALLDKGRCQSEMGHADEALRLCEDLEKRVRALPGNGSCQFAWQILCIRTLALAVRDESVAAMNVFCSVYASLPSDSEVGLNWMIRLVPNLLAAGTSERELVAVLLTDRAKSSALAPLVVALRECQGETVRASAEVRAVADDVRKRIEELAKGRAEAAATSRGGGR